MYDVVCVLSQDTQQCRIHGNDALSVFSRIANHACLSDRFGFLNQFSPFVFNSVETIPSFECIDTLEDLMLLRASEIYALAGENKTINVMWSGGVDSTAVVIAFLELNTPITVIHTASSIDEYPEFYEYLKSVPFVTLKCVKAAELASVCSSVAVDDLLVTGFPADQLFGSIVNQSLSIPFNADWKDMIKQPEAVEQFEAAFQFYKLPVKTVSELTWFMNFACKWNIVTHMLSAFYGLDCGNTVNYFEPAYFQQWCLSNFDYLHVFPQTDEEHYKYELKKFIRKRFSEGSYFFTKGKTGSLGYAHRYEKQYVETLVPWISWLDSSRVVHRQQHIELPYAEGRYVQNYMLNNFLNKQRRTQ